MGSYRELKERQQQDFNTSPFEVEILVPENEIREIDDYLHASTAGEYQGEDCTIIYLVKFPDGKEMEIQCCGCNDEPSWTQAVLFNECGNELCCTEPGDTFQGQWKLEYGGITYSVDVKPKEEDAA